MRKTEWVMGCAVVAILLACGGPQRGARTEGQAGGGAATETVATQPEFVPPERYDEIRASFTRRGTQASRCYRQAVDDGLVKEEAGRVTVALVVTADGKPKDVRITETSLNVKVVEDCIIKLVRSWDLPPPGVDVQFSFSYNFEHNW